MNFKTQIEEDIDLIKDQWSPLYPLLEKREYAFNHWILNRLYEVDEELINELITEYNDKSIDCYVHHEESKELYIIQNKYYDENSVIDRKSVADFLTTPLTTLYNNNYKKSKELQKIFNLAKNDPNYQIFFHFYITNNRKNADVAALISGFNNQKPVPIAPLLRASVSYLDEIKKTYYGDSYNDQISFKFTLSTKVSKNILRINPVDYDMPKMTKASYVLTPVVQLHSMNKQAEARHYPLYEENIRDYLGKSPINNGIIKTLKNSDDRSNFFYYNNGVTIICDEIKSVPNKSNEIELIKPQIINGCQTVNSISEVLSDYEPDAIADQFKEVFVMVKVLEYSVKAKENNQNFYRDIVKYTNKQNAINENAFGAKTTIFEKLQKEFKLRGFLLLVKPSDKNTFSNEYRAQKECRTLLSKADKFLQKAGLSAKNITDVSIPLDKLLQVYLAFMKDGYYAYTKKNQILKPTSEIYAEYSLLMSKTLQTETLIRLYLLYFKAESRRSNSVDKKTPIPYYLVGFLGKFIKDKTKSGNILKDLFESKNYLLEPVMNYFEQLTDSYKTKYFEKNGPEYNTMIKKSIDESILDVQIELVNKMTLKYLHPELESFFQSFS